MKRMAIFDFLLLLAVATCLAQQPSANSTPPSNSAPPAGPAPSAKSTPPAAPAPPDDDDHDPLVSSSHDTRVDSSPPRDDAQTHPNSKSAVQDLVPTESDDSDVDEFHPWNPLKAAKDIEVGDYYFKRKNYRAAVDRYKEALYYKKDDAIASFRLAVCLEKLGDKSEARRYFEQYLKILPEGPFAKEAHNSLDKLAKVQ